MSTLKDVEAGLDDSYIIEDEDAFIGIYGFPGQGKTVAALTVAHALGESILLYDTTDNVLALSNPETAPLLEGVTRYAPKEAGDILTVADALYGRKRAFADFDVVVIDEASTVAKDLLEAYIREKDGLADDELVGDFEAKYYGTVAAMMRSWLLLLQRTEGLHVILVSHERARVDQERPGSKTTVMTPEYWPGALTEYNKVVHVSARLTSKVRMSKGQPEYVRDLQSWPTDTVGAKSKIPMPFHADVDEFVQGVLDFYYPEDLAADE